MVAEVVAVRPAARLRLEPGDAGLVPCGHVVDMGDRVQPPGVVRRPLEPGAADALGLGVGAVLLEREGHAAHRVAPVRVRRVEARENARDRGEHAPLVAEDEADGVDELHRQRVLRMIVEDHVEDLRGTPWAPADPGGQSPDVSLLARRGGRGGHAGALQRLRRDRL